MTYLTSFILKKKKKVMIKLYEENNLNSYCKASRMNGDKKKS